MLVIIELRSYNLEVKIDSKIIKLVLGDITRENTEAIVNAANKSLRGGGGVDGAIHKAGGPAILRECIEKFPSGCETGEARITTAGLMAAKYVIHTPGPIYHDGTKEESELLKNCYKNSLLLANEYNIKSVSFPSISTGIYRYPIDQACKIALNTILDHLFQTGIEEVHFVLFSPSDFDVYKKNLMEIKKGNRIFNR